METESFVAISMQSRTCIEQSYHMYRSINGLLLTRWQSFRNPINKLFSYDLPAPSLRDFAGARFQCSCVHSILSVLDMNAEDGRLFPN